MRTAALLYDEAKRKVRLQQPVCSGVSSVAMFRSAERTNPASFTLGREGKRLLIKVRFSQLGFFP